MQRWWDRVLCDVGVLVLTFVLLCSIMLAQVVNLIFKDKDDGRL